MIPHHDWPESMLQRMKGHDYSDRAPTDFVVGGFVGADRRFKTRAEARAWVRKRYGSRVRRALPNCVGRWGYLIKADKP